MRPTVPTRLSSWRCQAAGGSRTRRPTKPFFAALQEANEFITKRSRKAAEIFIRIEHVKLTVEFVENLIKNPEFSYDPAPQNVMTILLFMNRIGRLKSKPESWKDPFFSEVHNLAGS